MTEKFEAGQPTDRADIEGSSRLTLWRRSAVSLLDDARSDPARFMSFLVVAVASAAFALWLLDICRQQWFVADEFDYFATGREYLATGREPLIFWLLAPHGEHTIVFTKLWFWILPDFVGYAHYEFYILPSVLAHLVVVAAIYRLTWISTASRVMATGTALVALAMGAGVGTLTYAGQFQYVGSVAVGLIVVILAVQSSGTRALVALIALSVLGTLNGTAFLFFAIAASIVYARRRLWREAFAVGAIAVGWELTSRLVWAPHDPYQAQGLVQMLREGPAFAYAILDPAISRTLGDGHLSAAVLTALVLGTLALISASPVSRRTAVSGWVVGTLAVAAILTMLGLVFGRLSADIQLASTGGYSYLFLVSLLPIGGILLAHIARSKAALLGVAGACVAISLVGVATISDYAASLATWKVQGEHVMQTAAAELDAGMRTFPDQAPNPDTAPTVSQDQLRSLAASGKLEAVIVGPEEVDQVSLNMQWRLGPPGQTTGVCSDLAAGQSFAVPVGASVTILGLGSGSAVDLQYESSAAFRQFVPSSGAASLQTLSQRPVVGTVQTASMRVCLPG